MRPTTYTLLLAICAVAIFAIGCAQNTEAPNVQPTRQAQSEDVTQQAQGARSDSYVYIFNAPGDNAVPAAPGGTTIDLGKLLGDSNRPETGGDDATPGGATVRDTRAGYNQNVYLTLQQGGTSSGAQATGGASGQSSAPGSSVTQTPTQEPKATVTTPIAVGLPGSAPQASGTGTVEGDAATTADQDADLKTLLVEAAAKDPAALQALLAQLLAELAQPTTQPAGTP